MSGALQTFRLQDAHDGAPPAPGWIVWIASVHSDSSLPRPPAPKKAVAKPAATEQPAAPPGVQETSAPKKPARRSTLPVKIFATLMSIGLILSTALGMIIALTNRAARRGSIVALVVGVVLPLVLLFA